MKIDFMEKWIHRYLMNVLQSALALLLAGTLHAEEGIRILSADPADNVLLEISTGTPRSVMASNDLKNWSYVFHYLPACQNFKAYAAQLRRKQTFYKLAPPLPALAGVVLESEIPSLEGKSFSNLPGKFSFSAGGMGTFDPNYVGQYRVTYSILDSRPGMISVRTLGTDGQKRDLVILMTTPGSIEFGQSLAYIADRFGDCISNMWGGPDDGSNSKDWIPHVVGSEVPVLPVSWPAPQGMVFRFNGGEGTVTLGEEGIATIATPGNQETVSYEYFATGWVRATVILSRSNGRRTTVQFSGGTGNVWHRTPEIEPYSLDGRSGADLLSVP